MVKRSVWKSARFSTIRKKGSKGIPFSAWYRTNQLTDMASFHAETSIMTTIWMLLTWDIVYDSDVKGVFETPYQSAPLDIVDDSFYYSRKEKFDKRMDEIRAGKAAEIITRHDTKYRPKGTWAIGVRWDICELQDLVEIVEVCRHRRIMFCRKLMERCQLSAWVARRSPPFVCFSAKTTSAAVAEHRISSYGITRNGSVSLSKSRARMINYRIARKWVLSLGVFQ